MASTRKASAGRQGAGGRAARPPEQKRRPGRPSKLTAELADQIIGYAREGNYIEVAAQAAGINKQTLYNWQAKAAEFDDASQEQLDQLDEETALLVWFVDALKTETALAEVEALRCVREQSNRWQAEAWFLERRHQTRYREHVQSRDDVNVHVTLGPDQVREELAAFGMPAADAVAAGPEAVEPPEDA